MRRGLSVLLAAILLLSLCACGSTEETETTAATQPAETSAPTEEMLPCGNDVIAREEAEKEKNQTEPPYDPVSVSSYDDIDKIYTFQLAGYTYSLPCTVSEFLDNGCMMYDSSLNATVPAQRTMGQLRVYPSGSEGSYVELSVMNDTDGDMTVQECDKVVGITVWEDSNVSLILSTGIDIGSGTVDLETMKAVYGADSPVYNDGQWRFYKLINHDYDGAIVFGLAPGMDGLTIDDGKIRLEYSGRP